MFKNIIKKIQLSHPVQHFTNHIQKFNFRYRYRDFSRQQLSNLLNSQNIQLTFNQLILAYSALKKYGEINYNVRALIQRNIFEYRDSLFATYIQTKQQIQNTQLDYYMNIFYRQNEDLYEQLAMARVLNKQVNRVTGQERGFIDKIKSKNQLKLMYYYQMKKYNISQLVQFIRIFKQKLDPRRLQQYISEIYEPLHNTQQIILFLYLTQNLKLSITHPTIPLQTKDPKSICLLSQLTQHNPTLLSQVLSNINWSNWSYQYIIWISQFLSQQMIRQAHKQFMKVRITNINTLIIYLGKLPKDLHKDVCQRLCNSDLFNSFKVQQLLNLLQYINEDEFRGYLRIIMKQCQGKYGWQQLNKIYYYSLKWGINNQDSEGIRIYIVNGYASLGTARSRIPTSSYYYKILQLISPQDLYKFKIDFGY